MMAEEKRVPEVYLDDKEKLIRFRGKYVTKIKRSYEIIKATPEDQRKEKLVKIMGFESLNHEEDYLKYYNIKKGDVVVDAGAHVGVFTQKFSELVGPDGLVIAIEPDFRALGMLAHNTADLKNVKILPYALWHQDDVIPFQYMDASGGVGMGSVIYGFPYWYAVRGITLDHLLKKLNIDEVDFVKMDIEGAEIRALEGMSETMKHADAMVIASYHRIDNEGGKSWPLVLNMLETKGFTTRKEQGKDGEIVYANR